MELFHYNEGDILFEIKQYIRIIFFLSFYNYEFNLKGLLKININIQLYFGKGNINPKRPLKNKNNSAGFTLKKGNSTFPRKEIHMHLIT